MYCKTPKVEGVIELSSSLSTPKKQIVKKCNGIYWKDKKI